MGAQKCVNPEKNNLKDFCPVELKIYYLFDFLDNANAILITNLDNAYAIRFWNFDNLFAILIPELW